jgi:hypothetical protein
MDIPTLFLTIVLTSGTLALTVGWVAEHRQPDGMLLWALGLVSQTIAYGLLSLRGAAPDWATVVLANGLLSLALALFGESLCQFHARRPYRALLWLPVPVAVACFAVLITATSARLLSGLLIFGFQALTVLVLLLQARRITVGRGKTLVFIGMASLLSVLLFRAACWFAGVLPGPPLPAASNFSSLTFMVVHHHWLCAGHHLAHHHWLCADEQGAHRPSQPATCDVRRTHRPAQPPTRDAGAGEAGGHSPSAAGSR